jgi:7-cyano-7-deazaguanine tRNA-ribosyltransferase
VRERAAREAATTDLDLFPIGAVVPLMKSYRFADLAGVVTAVKRGLDEAAPVHLFGAGHPMMFAFAAAMGCDLFDSAAYALFARDGKYLTVRGTKQLTDLSTFPCSCPVCSEWTPERLRDADEKTQEHVLAQHNLAVSFAEMRTVRQAITEGNLLELVETRVRGHPALVGGYRCLLDDAAQLEQTDPVSKDAFFHLSAESARRPEVIRHHDRLSRLSVEGELLLTAGNPSDRFEQSWRLVPPFGPVPRALSDVYPLAGEMPDRLEPQAYEAAATGVRTLVEANPDASVTLFHDDWPTTALETVPDRVDAEPLGRRANQGDSDESEKPEDSYSGATDEDV